MSAVAEQWAQLTPEDAAILHNAFELPSVLLQSDNIDARAMMAREVAAERAWRCDGQSIRPRDYVTRELYIGETIRAEVERICGEALV